MRDGLEFDLRRTDIRLSCRRTPLLQLLREHIYRQRHRFDGLGFFCGDVEAKGIFNFADGFDLIEGVET